MAFMTTLEIGFLVSCVADMVCAGTVLGMTAGAGLSHCGWSTVLETLVHNHHIWCSNFGIIYIAYYYYFSRKEIWRSKNIFIICTIKYMWS